MTQPAPDTATVTLAHGNGGRLMRQLIESVFVRQLGNPWLAPLSDAAVLPAATEEDQELVFTSDGVTVQPLFFAGGDIGSLAVHGTVNDLAVAGAMPRYLSVNAFLEEGLALEQLERIVESLAAAARACDVQVVAGDTKVLPRGLCGGLYFGVSGIGMRPRGLALGLDAIRPGDAVLVSGPVGDHGIAVMLAREEFGLSGTLASDSASVVPLTQALLEMPGLRFMRDPTRGGLATVLHEVIHATGQGVTLEEARLPIRGSVRSACDMLGYDPLYIACEGRVVAIVAEDQADEALHRWQSLPQGRGAQRIGTLDPHHDRLLLVNEWGGERLLQELEDDPLPRIC
ncbi:hydrogenase expression/formation protein HypE [Halomonas sp. ATCH28]|uniref:Hydrogenase expression/formation protein HypE n=1 Tax=Halomonas gemina TaxID=2945105 RepID=A0ABT0SZ09_9GAMM|nr:hydrogenase expression/formation protein HypE [Halomonas gemina]MCL7939689.1 hydrogenase expression/formation protein HypE [Halomonas gemina]